MDAPALFSIWLVDMEGAGGGRRAAGDGGRRRRRRRMIGETVEGAEKAGHEWRPHLSPHTLSAAKAPTRACQRIHQPIDRSSGSTPVRWGDTRFSHAVPKMIREKEGFPFCLGLLVFFFWCVCCCCARVWCIRCCIACGCTVAAGHLFSDSVTVVNSATTPGPSTPAMRGGSPPRAGAGA